MEIQRSGVVYVLRTYPALSESFIEGELRGLAQLGVPVSVVAIEPGVDARLAEAGARQATELRVSYVGQHSGHTRWPSTDSRGFFGRQRADLGALALEFAADVLRLRAVPRPVARALRLAVFAWRGRRFVPQGTLRLHAHFANDAATLARYISRLTGIPYIVTVHAYDLYQDAFLLGPNVAGAQRVITVSRANEEHLRRHASREGWNPASIHVLRCGIDLRAFPYRDPPARRSPSRVLCVARLVPKKGHEVLFRSIALLRARGVRIELTVAGDGPLAAVLERYRSREDLKNTVRMLGSVSRERVVELMRESDLVALASRVAEDGDRDGIPIVLMEAMALGIPVVATNVSGIPELLDAETGWLSGPDHPEELAAAMESALREPEMERAIRARRARARIEAEFDLRRQVEWLATSLLPAR